MHEEMSSSESMRASLLTEPITDDLNQSWRVLRCWYAWHKKMAEKPLPSSVICVSSVRSRVLRHEELWQDLKKLPVDYYIFVGAVCMEIIQPLMNEEWRERTFFTLDSRVAGEYIKSIIMNDADKYLLFAKGSQNTIYLEEALKYFIFPEEYLKLVRQDCSLYA
jgi:hypothetical protein